MTAEKSYDWPVIILSEVVGAFILYLGARIGWQAVLNAAAGDIRTILTVLFTDSVFIVKIYMLVGLILMLWPPIVWICQEYRRFCLAVVAALAVTGILIHDVRFTPVYFAVAGVITVYAFFQYE